jgi:hypothetical protein
MLDGMPVNLEDFEFFMNPSIADISGDDYPEAILGTGVYFVHAIDACGAEPPGWPKFTNGWITGAPAIGDVTGEGSLDVVATTRDGYMFAWKTKGTPDGVIQWESFHHDNQNTGSFAHTLDQGVTKRASGPPVCAIPQPPQYDATGCSCDLARSESPSRAWVIALLAGVLAIARRRRD